MTQRDAILVLTGLILALGIGGVLLVGSLARSTVPGAAPAAQVSFRQGSSPGAPAQHTAGVRSEADPQRVPPAFRPIVPVERGLANAARDAAGFLLMLLAISATMVLAQGHVLTAYHAAFGGWRVQARTFAIGLAALALAGCAISLTSVVFLGALTGGRPGGFGPIGFGGPLAIQLGLQAGFVALAVIVMLVLLPALVGFAAAGWRLGDLILGFRALSRLGPLVPAPLVALVGASVLYVFAQIPYADIFISLGALVYALGIVVSARLEPRAAGLHTQ